MIGCLSEISKMKICMCMYTLKENTCPFILYECKVFIQLEHILVAKLLFDFKSPSIKLSSITVCEKCEYLSCFSRYFVENFAKDSLYQWAISHSTKDTHLYMYVFFKCLFLTATVSTWILYVSFLTA